MLNQQYIIQVDLVSMYMKVRRLAWLCMGSSRIRYWMSEKIQLRKKLGVGSAAVKQKLFVKARSVERDPAEGIRQIFNKVKVKIQSTCWSIIWDLIFTNQQGRASPNLKKKLDQYLDIHRNGIQHSRDSLTYLLTAIGYCKDNSLNKYRLLIIQILSRIVQIETLTIDSECVGFFLQAAVEARSAGIQKSRSTSLLFFVINTLNNSFENIDLKFYVRIMDIIFADSEQGRSMKLFLCFTQRMQIKLHLLFLDLLGKDNSQFQRMSFISRESLIPKLTKLYYITEAPSSECVQSLMNIITERFLPYQYRLESNKQKFIGLLNHLYRCFPHCFQDKDGRQYKTVFLNTLYQRYYQHSLDFLAFHQYGNYFFSSIIYQYFNWYGKTRVYCHQDGFNYLLPSEIKEPPALPDFFWTIYHKNPANFNHSSFLRNTIKDCYPKKYRQTELSYNQETVPPFLDTEMAMRGEKALIQLGYDIKKQVYISGRYVDFLLPGNIVLEMDGIYHFQSENFVYKQDSEYRNMHLLLTGYRLILINIYEYNLNRETYQIKALIQKKMKTLQKHQAVLVI